jgi:tetratricopeptide (TPR) repeat protein
MSMEQAKEFIAQATQSLQSGQIAQAMDLANQAIALDPTNAEAFILKGIASAQSNQPEAASEAFGEAVRLDPNSSKAHFNLSVHQYGLGQKMDSLESSRKALQADPSHAGARDMIARLETELGIAAPAPTTQMVTPPSDGNTPYGGAPTQTPQNNPYYRSPYDAQAPQQQAGSVPFVENMGATWTTIGWVLVGVGLVLAVASMATQWGTIMEAFSNPQAAQSRSPFAMSSGPGMIFSLLGYIPLFGSLVWMCMDIANRRGNWVWLVPYVLCCCCGLPYIPMGIYMLAGRNK